VNFIQMMKVEIDEKLMKSIIIKRKGAILEQQVTTLAEIYEIKLETTEIEG
jgi:hypothetical protein